MNYMMLSIWILNSKSVCPIIYSKPTGPVNHCISINIQHKQSILGSLLLLNC